MQWNLQKKKKKQLSLWIFNARTINVTSEFSKGFRYNASNTWDSGMIFKWVNSEKKIIIVLVKNIVIKFAYPNHKVFVNNQITHGIYDDSIKITYMWIDLVVKLFVK